MKLFLCICLALFGLMANDSYAMFEKTNKSLLGRPKFRRPSMGTVYAGIGIGIPMYGATNISGTDFGDASANSNIASAVGSNTTVPMSVNLPMFSASVGYIQLSLPLRHEISLTFLSNSFNVYSGTVTVDGNPYTNSSAVIQNFFLTYYVYTFHALQKWPIVLFIGAGGGLAVFNNTFSDGGTTVNTVVPSTDGIPTDTTTTSNTTYSSNISSLNCGGVVGVAGGFTYRASDDLAIQVKLGYAAVSAPFGNSSSFPVMQMVTISLDLFFKIL